MAWRRNPVSCFPNSPLPSWKKAPGTSPILYLLLFYTVCVLFSLLFSGCLVGFHPGYILYIMSRMFKTRIFRNSVKLDSVSFWTIRDGSRILANLDCLELTRSTNVCKKPILSLFASSTSIESWTLSSILRRTLCLFFARAFCR